MSDPETLHTALYGTDSVESYAGSLTDYRTCVTVEGAHDRPTDLPADFRRLLEAFGLEVTRLGTRQPLFAPDGRTDVTIDRNT